LSFFLQFCDIEEQVNKFLNNKVSQIYSRKTKNSNKSQLLVKGEKFFVAKNGWSGVMLVHGRNCALT